MNVLLLLISPECDIYDYAEFGWDWPWQSTGDFLGRANLSRPLTLIDLLEIGIPADVVKAVADDLEIKAIYLTTNNKMAELQYNRWLLLL